MQAVIQTCGQSHSHVGSHTYRQSYRHVGSDTDMLAVVIQTCGQSYRYVGSIAGSHTDM